MTFNSISSPSTPSNSFLTTPKSSEIDPDDMKQILTYALPSAGAAILIVLIVVVTILRRQHVIEKWSSKKQMKNTDPDRTGNRVLRRDSEFESSDEDLTTVTVINDFDPSKFEPQFQLSTIS